jgi:hypothetical protein
MIIGNFTLNLNSCFLPWDDRYAFVDDYYCVSY